MATKNKKLKVLTVVGTRPEIIRLSRTICALDEYTNHVLVHTGQNYDFELNEVFFRDLEIRSPNYFLNIGKGKNPCQAVGGIIEKVDEILVKEKPDAFLVLGDTNSALSAYSAKRRKIPIFHMEAGNRCFSRDVPEEINRKVVDHLADVNLPYSSIAREYLLREGIHPHYVIKTGSPMKEVIRYYLPKVQKSKIVKQLDLTPNEYCVLSLHREENLTDEARLSSLLNQINRFSYSKKLPVIVSTHPRTRKRIRALKFQKNKLEFVFAPAFSFTDYLKLQLESRLVLSDSGTITEEASILGFNALNIRDTHERPEGMESASVCLSGVAENCISRSAELVLSQAKRQVKWGKVPDYDVDNVSEKIVKIIHSYYHNKFNLK